MSFDYNYDLFSLNFNSSCLNELDKIVLHQYNFYEFNGIYRGYVEPEKFGYFVNSLENIDTMKKCLMDIDYELILELEQNNIQSLNCLIEETNQIFYTINESNLNQSVIRKPNAWHLDLINQKEDNLYAYSEKQNNDNIDLWILDTGINWNHKEFYIHQVIDVDLNYSIFNITHAHGTGTASIAGGINYGASKNYTIYNYPICRFGGSCGSSDIEKGFITVLNHVKQRNQNNTNQSYLKRSVINVSVGIAIGENIINSSLGLYYNGIFKNITAYGGIIVVSAGNSNQNACHWLYSFSPYVISVGSINRKYNKSSFSNWGPCVDIWAFGESMPTAYSIKDNITVEYKTGTSFSSPLVAGLIVNLLNKNNTLNKDQLLNILQLIKYNETNNFIIPMYECGNENLKCCQSKASLKYTDPKLIITRLDKYCHTLNLTNCDKSCIIGSC